MNKIPFTAIMILILFAGCADQNQPATTTIDQKTSTSTTSTTIDQKTTTTLVEAEFSLDGNADEWNEVPLLIDEGEGDVPEKEEVGIMRDGEIQYVTHYNYDVTGLKMGSDEEYAYFLLELAKDVDYYLGRHAENNDLGDNIGYLFLDTDRNRNTGNPYKQGHWSMQKRGYEIRIGFTEGYTQGTNDSFISLTIDFYDPEKESFAYDFDKHGFDHFMMKSTDGDMITYKGRYIEARLPLSLLGIEKGQRMRAYFREPAESIPNTNDVEAVVK